MPNNTIQTPRSYSQNDQIDELVGVSPNWLLRSGIAMIALVIIVVLILAAFIKYPDKITARGIMTSNNPPIEHINNVAGIIEEVYVTNGAKVNENDLLLKIKNNTNQEDLDSLEQFIKVYKTTKLEEGSKNSQSVNSDQFKTTHLNLNFPIGLQLGELQEEYSQLQLLFSQLQQTLRQSNTKNQINTLKKELNNTRELRKILLAEKNYSKEELELIEKDYNRNSALNKEGIISDLEKEKAESQRIRFIKQYNNLDQGIIENKIREEQLIFQTQKLLEERVTTIKTHSYDIDQVINNIEADIKLWKRKYLVQSEISGEVSFVPNISIDQFISQNTALLSIIPTNNSNKKQVRVQITDYGIGKIKIDDKVIIKVDGYPYKEFGLITSKVNHISNLPEVFQSPSGEKQYLYSIDINLPETLKTNYDKEIVFRPNSSVTAEIITKDRSILERLFETFLSLLNKE